MARLRREAAEMFGSGEEPVFEDGTSLHEILTEFLEKDIIVVFERDGELYPTRVTAIIDPILDKEIIEQIKRKSNRGVESHG